MGSALDITTEASSGSSYRNISATVSAAVEVCSRVACDWGLLTSTDICRQGHIATCSSDPIVIQQQCSYLVVDAKVQLDLQILDLVALSKYSKQHTLAPENSPF